jgi:hypothetical protein
VHSSQTTAPVQFADLRGKRRVAAEVLARAYIAIIAEVAIASGAFYILFPELAALSHDCVPRTLKLENAVPTDAFFGNSLEFGTGN